MNADHPTVAGDELPPKDEHALRSRYVQRLMQNQAPLVANDSSLGPPRVLVQFWDDSRNIPADVRACLDSWIPLERVGFRRLLFDDRSAARFISARYSKRHRAAFENCEHPSMRADYFRLCFMFENGGLYADADDVYQGASIEPYISDGRLKLQSLCFDLKTNSMVDNPHAAASEQGEDRIFYVNNNPLIAPRRHPIIARALERATALVLRQQPEHRDVQALTGPGNLTACVVAHCFERGVEAGANDLMLLPEWESVAVSKWPLDYRADQRNWRIWSSQHG